MTSVVNIPSYDTMTTTGTPGKKIAKDKTAKKSKKNPSTADGEEKMKKRAKVSNVVLQYVCGELGDHLADEKFNADVVMVDENSKQQLEENQAAIRQLVQLLESKNLKKEVAMQNPHLQEGEKKSLKEMGYFESSDAIALKGTCGDTEFSITRKDLNAESVRAAVDESMGLTLSNSTLLDEKCFDGDGPPSVNKLAKIANNMGLKLPAMKIEEHSPCFLSHDDKAKIFKSVKCMETMEKSFKELETCLESGKNLLDEVEGDDIGQLLSDAQKFRASVRAIQEKIWNEQCQIIQSRLSQKPSSSKEMAAASPAPQSGNTSKMIANAAKFAKKALEDDEIWLSYGEDENNTNIFDGIDASSIPAVKTFFDYLLFFLIDITKSKCEVLESIKEGESEEESKKDTDKDKKKNKKRSREEEEDAEPMMIVLDTMTFLEKFKTLNKVWPHRYEKIFSGLDFAMTNFVEKREDGTQTINMKEFQQYIETNIRKNKDGSGFKLGTLIPALIKYIKTKKFALDGKPTFAYEFIVRRALEFGDATGCMKDIFLKMQEMQKKQQGNGKTKPDAAAKTASKPEPKKQDDATSSSISPQENETPEKDDSDSDSDSSDDEGENDEKKKDLINKIMNKIKGVNAKTAVGVLRELDRDARAEFKDYPAETTANPKKAILFKRLMDFAATLAE